MTDPYEEIPWCGGAQVPPGKPTPKPSIQPLKFPGFQGPTKYGRCTACKAELTPTLDGYGVTECFKHAGEK